VYGGSVCFVVEICQKCAQQITHTSKQIGKFTNRYVDRAVFHVYVRTIANGIHAFHRVLLCSESLNNFLNTLLQTNQRLIGSES